MITCIRLKYKGQEFTVSIDTADWDKIKHHRWSLTDCCRHKTHKLYVRRQERVPGERMPCGDTRRRTIYMHREIMGSPEGMVVDHIDGNGLNNCRANLKIISQEENAAYERQLHGRTDPWSRD